MALLTFLLMTGLLTLVIVGRRIRQRQRRNKGTLMHLRRCRCGYALAGLELPRCPECGRMIGFDKTAEELGISEGQMRAHGARRRTVRGE